MNQTRHQQLLSLIRRTISTDLREINHEQFHNVVVTDVLLSNDRRECRVWVDTTEGNIALLNTRYRSELHHLFMKQYPRRQIPKLMFVKDSGEVDKMDKLLATIEETEETKESND